MTLSAILSNITSIVTSSFQWAEQAITFITSHDLILMCVLFVFVGYGVHLVRMLLRR